MSVDSPSALRQSPAAPGPRYAVYWRETEPFTPTEPARGEIRCDVCIVGGGYTGLWTAYRLLEADPSLDVHIVEAAYAGAGASGHNDGFVTPTIGHSLHTVVRQFGPERAKAAYAAVGRSILELRRFCRKHDIDAELEPNGFFLVATSDAQMRRLHGDVRLAAEMGMSYELLDAAVLQEYIGSRELRGAIKTPGALVNPFRLARGLARVVRERGAKLHEQSEVIETSRAGSGHLVRTQLASIRAERLVLATNAYQHAWAPYRRQVKPVWSYAAVTEPLSPEQLELVPWPGREGFVEARNFIVFGRLTAENRLLIGGGPAPYFYGRDMDDARHLRHDTIQAMLRATLERYFPCWRGVRFEWSYGGCIAVTRDLVPHVGRSSDGAFHAYGYCGNGIAMTHTAGRALADLVLDRQSAHTELLFVNGREPAFPPEPLSFVGARALSAVLAWQDRHPRVLSRQLI